MSRFYAPPENIKGSTIYIDGQEARHILNVMRLKENDKVVVFDGTGTEYIGFIKEVKLKSVLVEVVSTRTPTLEKIPEITLAQCVPKKDKMDYIVEKSTELGVKTIIPLLSERTISTPMEKKVTQRLERWKKIARAASKQSGRLDVPNILKVEKFYNIIDKVNEYDLALLAYLSEDTIDIKTALSDFETGKIIVFIGPEGDFTPEEIKIAQDNTSCKFITLGKRVLKSDTAGLFVLSVLNYELA